MTNHTFSAMADRSGSGRGVLMPPLASWLRYVDGRFQQRPVKHRSCAQALVCVSSSGLQVTMKKPLLAQTIEHSSRYQAKICQHQRLAARCRQVINQPLLIGLETAQ